MRAAGAQASRETRRNAAIFIGAPGATRAAGDRLRRPLGALGRGGGGPCCCWLELEISEDLLPKLGLVQATPQQHLQAAVSVTQHMLN